MTFAGSRWAGLEKPPVQVAGVINAYTAMLAERAGFRALYLSGSGVATASFGLPDLGLTTLTEVAEEVRRITAASPLPLPVDADTGWGARPMVERAVRELERAGASAIQLEDPIAEKRCGHRPNKRLADAGEMAERIAAAVSARAAADADARGTVRPPGVRGSGTRGGPARGSGHSVSPGRAVSVPRLRIVLMRGGTSKGVFVSGGDLPPAGPARDRLLLALMGSPDPMQLDGLGGSHSSTSKVVAVSVSERPDTDVEYLFAQVGIDRAQVDYRGNCGNLTTAVGPYAIDEGLVPVTGPITPVRLLNRNTGTRIIAHVPVVDGLAATSGDCVVAGVPGMGAPIITEYLDPAGAVLGALLPTGRPRDTVAAGCFGPVEVSLVDVAGPVAFARAADLGLDPLLDPAAANADADLLGRLAELRRACAVLAGLAADGDTARSTSPALPRLALIGDGHPDRPGDFSLRALSMGRLHHACPMTVLMCAAAAALLPGTVPQAAAVVRRRLGDGAATIGVAHPKGVATATVRLADGATVDSVSITRTARRLLTGEAYL